MINVLTITISLVMIGAAFFALIHRSLTAAVIASGLVSLVASILYLLLSAPDVAMTEAAIGSGLSTVIFMYVLKHVKRGEDG